MLFINRKILRPSKLLILFGFAVGFLISFRLLLIGDGYHQVVDQKGSAIKPTPGGVTEQRLQRQSGLPRVRIFCWILTEPSSHWTKAVHVRDTWAKRCDRFLFMSTQSEPLLPAIGLNVTEGYEHLWGKTKAALAYLYRHHLNDADFFMKADDDTYVVMENLRHFLRNEDPGVPFYAGRRFQPFINQGFMTGGPGYVLSREALRRFVHFCAENNSAPMWGPVSVASTVKCPSGSVGAEDVLLGYCMQLMRINISDSLDNLGRERFHAVDLGEHLNGFEQNHWLWNYNYYPLKVGSECCSDTSIAFHYISPKQMRTLDFLIYRLRRHRLEATDHDKNPA